MDELMGLLIERKIGGRYSTSLPLESYHLTTSVPHTPPSDNFLGGELPKRHDDDSDGSREGSLGTPIRPLRSVAVGRS